MVDGCHVLYIGKATSLPQRLKQFAQFGQGSAGGHSGRQVYLAAH